MKNIGSVFLIIVLALVLLIVAGKLLPVKGAPENSSGPDSGNALQKGTEQITEGIVGGTGGGILNGIGGIEADILAGLGGIFKSLFGGPPAPGAIPGTLGVPPIYGAPPAGLNTPLSFGNYSGDQPDWSQIA